VAKAGCGGQGHWEKDKMPAIVSGVYKDGKVELLETPVGLREGRVRVMLVEEEAPKPAPRYLEFGKYKGDKDTTLEDFKDAEWHGEEEFDDLYGA
jgi:hypothetical protein